MFDRGQFITKDDYRLISNKSDEFIQLVKNYKQIIAISDLHIVRRRTDESGNFLGLVYKKNIFSDLYSVVKNVYFFFMFLFRSFFINKKNPTHSKRKVNFLFISHYTGDCRSDNYNDSYFGDIVKRLEEAGLSCFVAYIDQTSGCKEDVFSSVGEGRMLLKIRVNFLKLLSIYSGVFRSLFAIKGKGLSEIYGDIFHNCVFRAFSFNTIKNLIIADQVNELVSAIDPMFIVTTYEGHAWERLAFYSAREAASGIKCLAYQHAPVFKYQHAIKRGIDNKYDPDYILTSGYISSKQLIASKLLDDSKIIVIGSGRRIEKPLERKVSMDLSGRTCLVAPEGNIRECNILFQLSLKCNNDIKFIWRFPPMIDYQELIKTDSTLSKLPHNITISTGSLSSDISNSQYVLYRGSSVVIQCVAYGLIPIYYKLSKEFTIDPLHEISEGREIVSNENEFIEVFSKNTTNKIKDKLIRYAMQMYSPLDVSILERMMLDKNNE